MERVEAFLATIEGKDINSQVARRERIVGLMEMRAPKKDYEQYQEGEQPTLYDRIGYEGRLKWLDTRFGDKRLALKRERVAKHIGIYQERMTILDQKITDETDCLDEAERYKQQLAEFEELLKRSVYIPPEVVALRREEYQQMLERGQTDPRLKRGLEMLEPKKAEAEEERTVGNLLEPTEGQVVTPAARRVSIPYESLQVNCREDERELTVEINTVIDRVEGKYERFPITKEQLLAIGFHEHEDCLERILRAVLPRAKGKFNPIFSKSDLILLEHFHTKEAEGLDNFFEFLDRQEIQERINRYFTLIRKVEGARERYRKARGVNQ